MIVVWRDYNQNIAFSVIVYVTRKDQMSEYEESIGFVLLVRQIPLFEFCVIRLEEKRHLDYPPAILAIESKIAPDRDAPPNLPMWCQ